MTEKQEGKNEKANQKPEAKDNQLDPKKELVNKFFTNSNTDEIIEAMIFGKAMKGELSQEDLLLYLLTKRE